MLWRCLCRKTSAESCQCKHASRIFTCECQCQSTVTSIHIVCLRRQWPSYFQLPVLMLMLITLLNDGTLISIGYDRAVACTRPERWNLRQTFFIASVLGLVACLSSLLLLWMCLDAANPGSVFQRLGLPAVEYGKIITLIYLKARCGTRSWAVDTRLHV